MAKSPQLLTVIGNMDRARKQLRANLARGLMEAGLKLQGASQRRVPVDTGNLKASAYTRRAPSGALEVEVGYTSAYAVFVHENMEMKLKGQPRRSGSRKGKYWDPQPQAGPKFLQGAMNDNAQAIRAIILHHARIR